MAWKPNINRESKVTIAIAATTERFTQTDIAQRAGAVRGTVSSTLKEMERLGMIKVCRIGQHGIKVWCKTEKYRAPGAWVAEDAAASPPKSRKAYADDREQQAHTCLLDIAAAIRSWKGVPECA